MFGAKIKDTPRKSPHSTEIEPDPRLRPRAECSEDMGIIGESLNNATEASLSGREKMHFLAERRKHETLDAGKERFRGAKPEV
jgi:hypothetical protein